MTFTTIEVTGEAEINAAFSRMLSVGENPRPYLTAIGGLLKSSTQLRMDESRSPTGATWAPVRRGGKPLLDKGVHLKNTMNFRVDANSVTVGVAFAWASVHQFGKTITAKNRPYLKFKIGNRWAQKKSVTIPARPFLGISAEDRVGIVDILRREINGT